MAGKRDVEEIIRGMTDKEDARLNRMFTGALTGEESHASGQGYDDDDESNTTNVEKEERRLGGHYLSVPGAQSTGNTKRKSYLEEQNNGQGDDRRPALQLVRPNLTQKSERDQMLAQGMTEKDILLKKRREMEAKLKAKNAHDDSKWKAKEAEHAQRSAQDFDRQNAEQRAAQVRELEEIAARRRQEEQFQAQRDRQLVHESQIHANDSSPVNTDHAIHDEPPKPRRSVHEAVGAPKDEEKKPVQRAPAGGPRNEESMKKESARLKAMFLSVDS